MVGMRVRWQLADTLLVTHFASDANRGCESIIFKEYTSQPLFCFSSSSHSSSGVRQQEPFWSISCNSSLLSPPEVPIVVLPICSHVGSAMVMWMITGDDFISHICQIPLHKCFILAPFWKETICDSFVFSTRNSYDGIRHAESHHILSL